VPKLQVVIQALREKRRLLDFVRYFAVFEDQVGGILTKKIAGYHQFHTVNNALTAMLEASRPARECCCDTRRAVARA
jgi:type I restriction enzyme R subunit